MGNVLSGRGGGGRLSLVPPPPPPPLSPRPPVNRRAGAAVRGGVRLRLRTTAGLQFAQLPLDRLRFYVTGRDDVAIKLYELCLGTCLGTLVQPSKGASRWHEFLPASAIKPVGFDDDQALLPVTLRSFQGYRLLQEYFSCPARFRFFDLTGLP